MKSTKKLGQLLIVSLVVIQTATAEPYYNDDDDSYDPDYKVCFNVYCNFKKREGDRVTKKCEAAARFTHWVTGRGYETLNESSGKANPIFEVKCDNDLLFTGIGRRFTHSHGTQIQSSNGPFPGIDLPKYSLEVGQRTVKSHLILPDGRIEGSCTVYTGSFFNL